MLFALRWSKAAVLTPVKEIGLLGYITQMDQGGLYGTVAELRRVGCGVAMVNDTVPFAFQVRRTILLVSASHVLLQDDKVHVQSDGFSAFWRSCL